MIAVRDLRLDEELAPRALRGYLLGEKLGEDRFGACIVRHSPVSVATSR